MLSASISIFPTHRCKFSICIYYFNELEWREKMGEILSSYSLLIISSSLAGKVGNSPESFQSAWKPALPALREAFVSSFK